MNQAATTLTLTEAVREIIAVEKAVAEGAISEAEGLAKAETISRAVSERRDALRAAAQEKLAPGGKMLSEALESKLSFDARLAEKGGASFEGYRSVAKSAGKSRALVSALAKVGRVAGPLGVAVGVGLSAKAYADAPEDQKADVAVEETVAFGASAVGATGGTALGVAGAAGIATLAGLSGPPGWLLLGLGLLGGAGGAYGLSEASRHGVRSLQGR